MPSPSTSKQQQESHHLVPPPSSVSSSKQDILSLMSPSTSASLTEMWPSLVAANVMIQQQKEFKCPQCDKSYQYSSTLKRHMEAAHAGRFKYICQLCEKGYTTLRELKEHTFYHNNEPQFPCNRCPEKFKTLYTLKKHQTEMNHL